MIKFKWNDATSLNQINDYKLYSIRNEGTEEGTYYKD